MSLEHDIDRRKPKNSQINLIPQGLNRTRTRASAVKGQWLTTWAMARPRISSIVIIKSLIVFRFRNYFLTLRISLTFGTSPWTVVSLLQSLYRWNAAQHKRVKTLIPYTGFEPTNSAYKGSKPSPQTARQLGPARPFFNIHLTEWSQWNKTHV
jgi:hypothetical protein